MIVLHATVPIAAEHREDALELIADLAERSRAEDGMIEYRATTDVEDPNTVRFFEQYEDEAALGEWLAGEPEVWQFEVSEARELDL